MEFDTEAQRECYDTVAPWITELFSGSVLRNPEKPLLGIVQGSAFAQVGVFPWGDDDAIITTRAYVVTGAELTPELMQFLLQENGGMHFGAFGLDDDRDIFFVSASGERRDALRRVRPRRRPGHLLRALHRRVNV
jgi:hypothetical protein